MGLVGACRPCSEYRYCGIADPRCHRCEGTGRVVGGDIVGVDPIIVLRAAIMGLDRKVPRAVLLEKGLLAHEPPSTTPPGANLTFAARSAMGRAAGKLLVELGLRPPSTRKVLTPEDRRERKEAKAAQAERDRLMIEHLGRRTQERANEQRRAEVARRAALALADAHPEEYESERETQEVFVALEEGFGTYLPPAVRRVMG